MHVIQMLYVTREESQGPSEEDYPPFQAVFAWSVGFFLSATERA